MIIKNTLAAAILAGLTVTMAPAAKAEQQPDARSFGATQAISYNFGSKRAVGYFAPQNGACALTMFVAEAEEGHVAPSAMRVRFVVKPGDSAELASVEGKTLEVKCGANAALVEVRQTGYHTTAATQ